MIPVSLQRVTRRFSMLAVAMAGAFVVSAPISQAQTVYPITNYDGTILASAASLYTLHRNCYNAGSPPGVATICEWYVRKLYGDQSAVVVVIHQPHGSDPACYGGATQMIVSGYTRSGCNVYATAAAYGH